MLLVATIQDVARLAGVSPTTAKRALREPDRLSPGTLKRVQAAVRSLDYEPDQRAGSLRGGQSRTIGLIVASIVEPFFAQFARTVGQTLAGAGYTLLISENEYSAAHELPELQRLYGQRVAGVILRPGYGPESRDYLRRLTHKGLHLLEYDYTPPGSPYPHVMLGNAAAMEDAVRYLHGLGHERVAALGTYHPQIHPEVRSEAFPRIMAGLGLTVPADYQRVTQLTEETAYSLTHELMALAAPPTAIIALTGTQGIGAYRAIRERGWQIPDDISLVTFDNYPWTALVTPPVTVVQQPVQEMAVMAARTMLALIDGHPVTSQVFPAELIPRLSCAAPRVPAPGTAG
jgi:LacI family transcriptional regulator